MKTAAVISEYNPFHKGHEYQIRMTREKGGATHILALMSGNFVQRGLPAIIDKYRRAEMALSGGADLVLELPAVYAISSAEFFAEGSVKILNALGGVDMLSFGSEEGDLFKLKEMAEILASEEETLSQGIRKELTKGISYAHARSSALKTLYPHLDTAFIESPNNILGVEYLKALIRTGSSMVPFTIKRAGMGYHDLELSDEVFASATALRRHLHAGESIKNFVPGEVGQRILLLKKEDYPFVSPDDFRDLLYYRLITDEDALSSIPEAGEGLDRRIISFMPVLKNEGVEAFIDAIKTRRYARTRISRILIQFLLSFDRADTAKLRRETPSSVKILGFNDKGKEILASLRKDRSIDLLHNAGRDLDQFQEIDFRAGKIYSLKNSAYDPLWDHTGFRP